MKRANCPMIHPSIAKLELDRLAYERAGKPRHEPTAAELEAEIAEVLQRRKEWLRDTLTDEQIHELRRSGAIDVATAALCISASQVRSRYETREEYQARLVDRDAARMRCAELIERGTTDKERP